MTAYSGDAVVMLAATPQDAADVRDLTREVFATYAALAPQSSSLRETVDDVADQLDHAGGLVVRTAPDGTLLAAARFSEHDGGFWLRRVAVRASARRQGMAGALAARAEEVARERGYRELRVGVRAPLVEVADVWRRLGFREVAAHGHWVELVRPVPLRLAVPTPGDMEALGRRLAEVLRAGDLVLLTGDLGAGKTTLTRGLGAGLAVRGAVTSPTFVIARVHPPTGSGPALVHVDAYRLGSIAEVDDLDLDASLDDSVTVVEWGEDKVEDLAESRLELRLRRSAEDDDETRTVEVRAVGLRWDGVDLDPMAHGPSH